MKHLTVALFLLAAVGAASAQEEIRKKKKGWADLGLRLETSAGAAVVAEVYAGGAGAKAGVATGDVILAFDGLMKPDAEKVMVALWSMETGRTVKFVIDRKGERKEFETATVTIEGQKIAGMNNTMHHPPAIRAVAIEPVKAGAGEAIALYAFDLVVSFDWKLTEAEWKAARTMAEKAAEIFFDASEGQMIWRRIELYDQKGAWERAHYRIGKQQQGGVGIEHVTPGGQCDMKFAGALDQATPAVIWAHEAGHMQFGSGDEYPYGEKDPQTDCDCLMGRGCFNGQWDLCLKGHAYQEKESCWENAKRWYPNLIVPGKPAKGPALKVMPEIVLGGVATASDLGKRIEERVAKLLDERMAAIREEVLKTISEALRK
jgi:hypothetical protein